MGQKPRFFFRYYDAPILTDESDEDYLEHDLDFQNWRQTQSQRALRISSEVKKWRKIKEAEDKKALTYVPGHYTISYARPQTAFVSTRGRSSKKSRSRSKSRGRSKSFTKSLRSKSRSARTYREEQTQIRNFLRSASPKTAEYELNNALETVKRAKDYLEKINHADQTVKAHLINKDPTQFRRYLETLKEKDLAKYLAFQNLNAHDDLDNSFERLNISSKSLTSPRYNSKKVMLAAEQQPFKFNKYDRLEGSGHYGPPFNKTKTSTFIDSGLTNCYKGASSIPVQKVDSFYLGYF